MDAAGTSDAGAARRRRGPWLILVATVVLVITIAVIAYFTVYDDPQATADGVAEEIADVMTSGDEPALRALFCPRGPELPPLPDRLVPSPTPVSVSALEVKDNVAGLLLTSPRDPGLPYGLLLVRSEKVNWCVFGFKTCVSKVTAAMILKPQYLRLCS
ncbi:hypothetical protein [Amycolatopsis sp. lyj-90]|uniref:hypothetical protein n=1 Tax=Amycolatopsis sp. lyj-90 TaxID=2789285 RepID=UPI00397AD810